MNTAFKGRGGIYEFYWGNAFKVFKNFSLGCNISYLFGNYDKIRTAEFSDDLFLNFKGNDKTSMKGALFSFGTQYFIPVKINHRHRSSLYAINTYGICYSI